MSAYYHLIDSSVQFTATLSALLWFRTAMNRDLNSGPLAHPCARSLTPLTHLLAPPCLLRSLIRCAGLFARSLTPKLVGKLMSVSKSAFSEPQWAGRLILLSFLRLVSSSPHVIGLSHHLISLSPGRFVSSLQLAGSLIHLPVKAQLISVSRGKRVLHCGPK